MSLTLKALRVNVGLTQENVANELGVHLNTYRAMELNPESIDIKTARRLASIFKVETKQIYFIGEQN